MNQRPDDCVVQHCENEYGRAWVSSRSRPGKRHLVDVSVNPPMCDCEFFRFRCLPLLERGEKRRRGLMCWHILELMIDCCEKFFDRIREADEKESGFVGVVSQAQQSHDS